VGVIAGSKVPLASHPDPTRRAHLSEPYSAKTCYATLGSHVGLCS
jgi:hypothetical protein